MYETEESFADWKSRMEREDAAWKRKMRLRQWWFNGVIVSLLAASVAMCIFGRARTGGVRQIEVRHAAP